MKSLGQLLTSSNYDDNKKKVTGGRNGFGAKLANIFSTEFIVETADSKNKKMYKQRWRNNMSVREEPVIKENPDGKDFTCITFKPDLRRFGMEALDDDIVALMTKRAYDAAGSTPA
jgi:DNA topoisomerase-2